MIEWKLKSKERAKLQTASIDFKLLVYAGATTLNSGISFNFLYKCITLTANIHKRLSIL